MVGTDGPVRLPIADAVEEDEAVAVRSEVVRVLMSPVAGVIEGVVELESGFELACNGLVAGEAELPADLVEFVGLCFVWGQVVELAELVGLRLGDMFE